MTLPQTRHRLPVLLLTLSLGSACGLLSGCSGPGAAGSPGALPTVPAIEETIVAPSTSAAPLLATNGSMIAAATTAEAIYPGLAWAVKAYFDEKNEVWHLRVLYDQKIYEVIISPEGDRIIDRYIDESSVKQQLPDLRFIDVPLGQALALAMADKKFPQDAHLRSADLQQRAGHQWVWEIRFESADAKVHKWTLDADIPTVGVPNPDSPASTAPQPGPSVAHP